MEPENSTDTTDNLDYQVLESLIVDNYDLEQLEGLLDQFNIFEALGAVKVELRHSDFLAFLLSPNQSHGTGDAVVKRFLQKVLSQAHQMKLPLTPIDLDLWDLDELSVQREWQNIDILMLGERNRFFIVIENKVVSTEHSDQLSRYRQIVEQHYPGWKGLYLFLTPEGDQPSEPDYIPIDYGLIASLVEQFTESRSSTLGPDVRTLMTHYCQMLRRHIVSESQIAELCRKIYRKHQRALDLIYEYRPDLQEEIQNLLEKIVQERKDDLELDHSSKSWIRFAPKEWNTPVLLEGQGWTRSGRILLFQFGNHLERLKLYLVIGPGPEQTRQKLFDLAHHHRPPFAPAFNALGKNFNTIFDRSFLTPKSYENASLDELEQEIRKKWAQFLEHDLPTILDIFRHQDWMLAK